MHSVRIQTEVKADSVALVADNKHCAICGEVLISKQINKQYHASCIRARRSSYVLEQRRIKQSLTKTFEALDELSKMSSM